MRRRLVRVGVAAVALAVLTTAVAWVVDGDSELVTQGWDALAWSPQGELLHDLDLLHQATEVVGHDYAPRVLFAGEVQEHRVVVLGVSVESCERCVATVVDGEVREARAPGTTVRGDRWRFRPITFDAAGNPLLAPVTLPEGHGRAYLLHPGVDADPIVLGPGPPEPVGSGDHVLLVPEAATESSCRLAMIWLVASQGRADALVVDDYFSVQVATTGELRPVGEEAPGTVRDTITSGVAHRLAGCNDSGLAGMIEVFGEETVGDFGDADLTEPVTTNIAVQQLSDTPLRDPSPGVQQEGRLLWLEWRRDGSTEPNTATVGWQEPSDVVHLASARDRGDGFTAHHIVDGPWGPMVVVTGPSDVRDDLVRFDADDAEVLGAGPGFVALDMRLDQHVVTLYGADDQVLQEVVLRAEDLTRA